MGKGIIDCKGPYEEGAVLLPEGMTIIATQLHRKWDSDDYRLKVEHPDIPDRSWWQTTLPRIVVFYGKDENGNKIITNWDIDEYT